MRDLVKCMKFIVFLLVFQGLEGVWRDLEDPLGCLGEYFGGLGGSWGQARISMDSGTLPGTTQILRQGLGEGRMPVWGGTVPPYTVDRSTVNCRLYHFTLYTVPLDCRI